MWERIKHKFAKWIWRNNSWTRAVDDIEKAVKDIHNGSTDLVALNWKFTFIDPDNIYSIVIKKLK